MRTQTDARQPWLVKYYDTIAVRSGELKFQTTGRRFKICETVNFKPWVQNMVKSTINDDYFIQKHPENQKEN